MSLSHHCEPVGGGSDVTGGNSPFSLLKVEECLACADSGLGKATQQSEPGPWRGVGSGQAFPTEEDQLWPAFGAARGLVRVEDAKQPGRKYFGGEFFSPQIPGSLELQVQITF